jgi:hypothetical protein
MKIKYKQKKYATEMELNAEDMFKILTSAVEMDKVSFQDDGNVEYCPAKDEEYIYGPAVFNKKTGTVTVKNED